MKKLIKTVLVDSEKDAYNDNNEGILYLVKTDGGYKAGNYLIEDPEVTDFEYLEKVYNRIHNEPIIIAETDRIIVRENVLADASELYRILQTPSVREFVDEYMMNYADFCEKLEAYRTSYDFYDCGFWGVFEKETDRLIGRCGIQYSTIDGEILPELGFLIAPEYTGKGYAYESAMASLQYAFDYLGEAAVYARIREDNFKSRQLIKKLKFVEKKIIKSGNYDIILYVKTN